MEPNFIFFEFITNWCITKKSILFPLYMEYYVKEYIHICGIFVANKRWNVENSDADVVYFLECCNTTTYVIHSP